MDDQRKLGLKLAVRCNLPETAALIADPAKCYPHIFRQAIEELGSFEALIGLVLFSKSTEFIYQALVLMGNLSECHKYMLLASLATSKGSPNYYPELIDFKDVLSAAKRNSLVIALAKSGDANSIYSCLKIFTWFNARQRNILVKALIKIDNPLWCWRASCYLGWLTKTQRKLLCATKEIPYR